jgi:hypothetical protein
MDKDWANMHYQKFLEENNQGRNEKETQMGIFGGE